MSALASSAPPVFHFDCRLGCPVVWLVGWLDTPGFKQEMDLDLAGSRGEIWEGDSF